VVGGQSDAYSVLLTVERCSLSLVTSVGNIFQCKKGAFAMCQQTWGMSSWQMARRLPPINSPKPLCGSWLPGWPGGNWEISCEVLQLQPAKRSSCRAQDGKQLTGNLVTSISDSKGFFCEEKLLKGVRSRLLKRRRTVSTRDDPKRILTLLRRYYKK